MNVMQFFHVRMKNLKKSLDNEGFDGYIVAKDKNILYFTGFQGGARLLITEDESTLYVHSVNYESAKRTAKNCNVMLLKRRDADSSIVDLIKKQRLSYVGFDSIAASTYVKLTKAIKNVKLEAQGKLVSTLRETKDETELQLLKKAAELASEGMKTAYEIIKPGLRENEVAAEIEYTMRRSGSDGVAFDSMVATGVRSAFPHAGCTNKKIQRGHLVVIDIGAKYRNYMSDLTRTIIVGRATSKQNEIYKIVRNAQNKALYHIQSGIKACDVDSVARELIENKGYGKYFVHSLGHGVGLDIHETPTLTQKNTGALKLGNVVTVEPGIYIPNFGGVRIEDTVLVGKNGAEKLTNAGYLTL